MPPTKRNTIRARFTLVLLAGASALVLVASREVVLDIIKFTQPIPVEAASIGHRFTPQELDAMPAGLRDLWARMQDGSLAGADFSSVDYGMGNEGPAYFYVVVENRFQRVVRCGVGHPEW